ncbi:hypothetical protein [Streptococcus sobrinus]|uniref:hypothetical protein n=1 Tax=Streptococcus sobrinus TaxID=1310 RepID=UPI0002F92649|nr:hypothetical protein [Streptococcus sobrinus]
MKEKSKIVKGLKWIFEKGSWNGDIRLFEFVKWLFSMVWFCYFLIEFIRTNVILETLNHFLYSLVSKCDFIKRFYEIRVHVLMVITVVYLLCVLVSKYTTLNKKYQLLPFELNDEFVKFQISFKDFMKGSRRDDDRIYWLDGPWGSGKTYFIHTFFKFQQWKYDEIYYVSCFGLVNRNQVEKALVTEIENHSILGNLDFIPIVGSLIKWFYKMIGLDGIKKHSIIIFDDLERVVHTELYGEKYKDNPKDYNDILGFIDYLANHKNHKLLVLYDSTKIPNTQRETIESKFKPTLHSIPSAYALMKIIQERMEEPEITATIILVFQLFAYSNEKNYRTVNKFLVKDFISCLSAPETPNILGVSEIELKFSLVLTKFLRGNYLGLVDNPFKEKLFDNDFHHLHFAIEYALLSQPQEVGRKVINSLQDEVFKSKVNRDELFWLDYKFWKENPEKIKDENILVDLELNLYFAQLIERKVNETLSVNITNYDLNNYKFEHFQFMFHYLNPKGNKYNLGEKIGKGLTYFLYMFNQYEGMLEAGTVYELEKRRISQNCDEFFEKFRSHQPKYLKEWQEEILLCERQNLHGLDIATNRLKKYFQQN